MARSKGSSRASLRMPACPSGTAGGRPRRASRTAFGTLATCLLLAAASLGQAQTQPLPTSTAIYTCRDASGRMLTSDRPIAECSNRPMRELSNSGTLRREIDAPLTAEQQRQRREAERRLAQAEEQRRLVAARDRALLMTYGSLESLEAARNRQMTEVRRDIGIVETRLAATTKDLASAKTDLARADSQNSQAARRRVEDVTRVMESDQDRLNKLRSDEARINGRFDEDGLRLRTLLGQGSSPEVAQATSGSAASAVKTSSQP